MQRPAEEFNEALLQVSQLYTDILFQYCRLWSRKELTEEEADCLNAIYTQAEKDSLLDFFITKVDEVLCDRAGLLSDEFLQSYKNQQAWLREHLEQIPFEQDYLVEGQKFLKAIHFYEGPVDGVWGDRTCKAATKYRKRVQELLRKEGLYNGKIDGELGEKSVNAIQTFQRQRNLRNDGVPGPQTYAALQKQT